MQTFVFKENGEWLRYVLWACAGGLLFLSATMALAQDHDSVKIIASLLGVLLFGFSGFVFQTRVVTVDPVRRRVTVISRRFRRQITETLDFDGVRRIQICLGYEYNENYLPANRWQEEWFVVLDCAGSSVAINTNPFNGVTQAQHLAVELQRFLKVPVTDELDDGFRRLVELGRKIDAIAMVARTMNMSTTQAKDYIDKLAGSSMREARK